MEKSKNLEDFAQIFVSEPYKLVFFYYKMYFYFSRLSRNIFLKYIFMN